MFAALLLASAAASFCEVWAQDDHSAALELLRQGHGTLTALKPDLLSKLTPEAREQFLAIITDRSLTVGQIRDKLNSWVAQQGQEIQTEFEEATKKLHSAFAKVEEAIEQSSLSDAAKKAFAQIGKLAAKEDETAAQQAEEVTTIIDSLPEDVRNEMKNYVKSVVETAFEKIKSEVQ
uniref:SXP/RAL-2 family protein Ani s 5-like cation-binding domain-containing protein n=1 Tax=Parascaris univalens TaxID=6257 RepID=A0A914ZMS9_PARUN